ncbi:MULTISPECIES: deoxyribose-phosphate aldolase [Megamonas]|jgi:deoxyribose-phosphate aldolase|uniref:Deoxyribose-phosphate aldolase n=1 Tax=Megamonas funiformis TaxID=437897 RepID=A0AAW4U7G1_9FIRM|nr:MULTISPECIES: deoxyribose-phosphate aldolase [Megamonas]MBD9297683.1 deoxyribose-phosphate aldolase [Megamonas funiformis]MBS7212082.1 deoxyribose-phosphate aldolase [Megamonas funiformis]MCB6829012.1 deoxyribose-phosphate aldolase [Megamonas funiformis]
MNINKLIDHTALKPNTNKESILKLIAEAKTYDFASVCVNPCWVALAHQELKNTDIKVCTVIGFPLGANTTEVKVFETKDAIEKGAQEIDMVINIAMLKDKEYDYVENEIHQIVEAAKDKAIVKIIIETCLLTDEEKIKACELSQKAGADFVKTSTGFSTGGATVHDIALMRKTVGAEMGVKASGGVHTHEEALAMVEAGATRIGASAGVKLLK